MGIAGTSLIIWLPTRTKGLKRIAELAKLSRNEKFYDLGCGNGKVVFYMAKEIGARTVGIELAWPLFLFCLVKQKILGYNNCRFELKNIFNHDFRDGDVIYVFGIPDKLKNKLKPIFELKPKPGRRIISYAFAIEGWTPTLIDKPTPDSATIFIYEK